MTTIATQTSADNRALSSEVARIREKANEGFRALATAAADILAALDDMSALLAKGTAIAPEDAFSTPPDNLGTSPHEGGAEGSIIAGPDGLRVST